MKKTTAKKKAVATKTDAPAKAAKKAPAKAAKKAPAKAAPAKAAKKAPAKAAPAKAAKKSPAKTAPAKAAKKSPAKAAPAKAAKKAPASKKASSTKAPANGKKNGQPLPVEKEAAALLDDYDNGKIRAPFSILEKIHDLDLRLPKRSSLRPDFDKMLEVVATKAAKG